MPLSLYGWPKPLQITGISLQKNISHPLKFSIVIPTLNHGDTIEHTLLSIINQDYLNFEIIIVDGGSSDDTEKIIKNYSSWIQYYVSGKDTGQSNAINHGFSVATGDIYAWINSDDFYLPFAFQRVAGIFEGDENIDIVVGSGDVVSKNCRFLKHINAKHMVRSNLVRWIEGEWIMQQSCFWTNKIWKRSGGVDESLKLLMDIDLWFRFSKLGNTYTINEPIAAMRYYPEIKTVALKDVVKEETAYVFAKNGEIDLLRQLVKELAAINKRFDTNSVEQLSLFHRIITKVGLKP